MNLNIIESILLSFNSELIKPKRLKLSYSNYCLCKLVSAFSMRLFLLFILASSVSFSDELKSADSPKAIEMYIGGISSISSPPYSWVDQCTNELQGSSRHLLKKLLADLGVEVIYSEPLSVRSAELRKRFRYLKDGTFDALVGVYKKQDNDRITLNNVPIIEIDSGVIYQRDSTRTINGFDDLLPLRGAIPSSNRRFYLSLNTGALGIDEFNALNLTRTETLEEAVDMLRSDEVDFVISDRYRFRTIDKQTLIKSNYKFTKLDEFSRKSYLAVKAGSKFEKIFPELDKKLIESKQKGYITFLEEDYLLRWHNGRGCKEKL